MYPSSNSFNLMASFPNEEQLVKALQANQAKAFSQLYDSHASKLYSLILRMVHSQTQAEDLLQESFIKVWKNIHRYDSSQGRLLTWMLTIAYRTTLDALEAHKRYKRRPIESRESFTQPQLTNGDVRPVVDRCLEERLREAIELVYYRDYTHEEAAKELGVPLGTFKTRLRTAVQVLKRVYKRDIYLYHVG